MCGGRADCVLGAVICARAQNPFHKVKVATQRMAQLWSLVYASPSVRAIVCVYMPHRVLLFTHSRLLGQLSAEGIFQKV